MLPSWLSMRHLLAVSLTWLLLDVGRAAHPAFEGSNLAWWATVGCAAFGVLVARFFAIGTEGTVPGLVRRIASIVLALLPAGVLVGLTPSYMQGMLATQDTVPWLLVAAALAGAASARLYAPREAASAANASSAELWCRACGYAPAVALGVLAYLLLLEPFAGPMVRAALALGLFTAGALLVALERRSTSTNQETPTNASPQMPKGMRGPLWFGGIGIGIALVALTRVLTDGLPSLPTLYALPPLFVCAAFILAPSLKPAPWIRDAFVWTALAILPLTYLSVSGLKLTLAPLLLVALGMLTLAVHAGLRRRAESGNLAPALAGELALAMCAGWLLAAVYSLFMGSVLLLAIAWGGVGAESRFQKSLPHSEKDAGRRQRMLDAALPLLLLGVVMTLGYLVTHRPTGVATARLLTLGVALVGAYCFRTHPVRFGISIFVVGYAVSLQPRLQGTNDVHRTSQWGQSIRVLELPASRVRVLAEGVTNRGGTSLEYTVRDEPRGYYQRSGPIGDVISDLQRRDSAIDMLALGVGAGAFAAHVRRQDHAVLVEWSQKAVDIARDDRFFSFIKMCEARCEVIVDNARPVVDAFPADRKFDLIFVDAAARNNPPTHLLSIQAMDAYLEHLADDGIMLVHATSAYVQLERPVVAAAMALGLTTIERNDKEIPDYEAATGKLGSRYLAIARNASRFESLLRIEGWGRHDAASAAPWHDGHAELWSLLRL